MRLDNLHQELQRVLHPREALRRLFPDWSGINNERVPCPFHEDTNPSLSLSATGHGKANCFGCPYQSSNYVGLAGDLWYSDGMPGQENRGRRFARALRILYSEQVDDLSKGNEQKRQHKKLLRSPKTLKKLERRQHEAPIAVGRRDGDDRRTLTEGHALHPRPPLAPEALHACDIMLDPGSPRGDDPVHSGSS